MAGAMAEVSMVHFDPEAWLSELKPSRKDTASASGSSRQTDCSFIWLSACVNAGECARSAGSGDPQVSWPCRQELVMVASAQRKVRNAAADGPESNSARFVPFCRHSPSATAGRWAGARWNVEGLEE